MAITTKFWTLAEITAKLERDLDIEEETFIQTTELTEYINEGIDICENLIHTIYEDYFLTKASLSLTLASEEVSMPTSIFAHKIRSIIWRNGSDVYEVKRIRDWKKFIKYSLELVNQSSNEYCYFITNGTAGSPKIILSPPAKSTDSTSMTCWYLRQANRLVQDADVCDIPEFVYFVMQHVKVRVYEKESHPMLQKAMADLASLKEEMTDTLTGMVADNETELEADFSHYNDSVGD